MAKINSGILGPLSGKVSGVVGGSWRGVPYIRGYAKPGYSNTDAQDLQRKKLAYIVQAGKPFVGRVFNPYYDKFLSKRSGFNQFIAQNIQGIGALADVTSVVIIDGPLYPGSALTLTSHVSPNFVINWGIEHGVDGDDDDVAIAYVRDPISNLVEFGTNSLRDLGVTPGITISNATLGALAHVEIGIFFARTNLAGDVVQRVSRNLTSYVATP